MMTDSPGVMQHNGGGRARRVGRAGNGDAAVGLLQRRGIVHAVAGHADDVAVLLQDLDDVEFVLGEHLGEAVGMLDGLGHAGVSCCFGVAKAAGIENVCAHAEFLGGFLGDGQRIAGHHLDLDAHLSGGRDGRLGVLPRRIEQRQHAEELPFAVALGPRHAQGTKTARGEFVDGFVDGGFTCAGIRRQRQDHLRRALGHLERLAVRAVTVASVRLCTGSNGWKWVT